jgi:crotonobetainyl-CoA:carnitine CoA-transferase CaiB-like acyl-CoA transferase
MASGMLAYAGVVTALLARASGKAAGQRVDVSLLETGVSLIGFHALNWMIAGIVDQREGGHNSRLVPYGPHRCQDGDIMLGVPNDGMWHQFCQTIQAEHLLRDPRFATNALRCQHFSAATAAIEEVLIAAPVQHWVDVLARAGIACAPINTLDKVLVDQQVLANDMIVHAPTHDGRTIPLVGLPFKLSATPGRPGHAPPSLGQHTEPVLRRYLGLDANALADLRTAGAIL